MPALPHFETTFFTLQEFINSLIYQTYLFDLESKKILNEIIKYTKVIEVQRIERKSLDTSY